MSTSIINILTSTLVESGTPGLYPTRPFLQMGSTHRNCSGVTCIRWNCSRKMSMRVSNTTIKTGVENEERNEVVRIVGIVGQGSASPLNSASWYDVMLHTVSSPFILFSFLSNTHTHIYPYAYMAPCLFLVCGYHFSHFNSPS